jgi:uncharacterized protein VirK/YbjX
MTSFVSALLATHGEFRRAKGASAAAKRVIASLRVLAFPGLLRRMAEEGYLKRVERKRGADGLPWDPFHFISHPGYLVRGYSLAQRFRAALHHYRFEGTTFDEAMLQTLYSPPGFTLWSADIDGHHFAMRMGLAGEETLEGDLFLRLFTDGQQIGSMNFVWADAAMFGRPSAPTIFITRCQTHTWPELQVFRACFKQNSPPYFGLAALAGIGKLLGMTDLYAVHGLVQMHYEPKYESNFRNSYDEFWEKFSAERVQPEAFRMPLPLALRDLSELKSKHRSRAEGRRRAWGAVGEAAAAAMARHLRGAAPAPAAPERGDVSTLDPQAKAMGAAALLAEGLEHLPSPLLLPLG